VNTINKLESYSFIIAQLNPLNPQHFCKVREAKRLIIVILR